MGKKKELKRFDLSKPFNPSDIKGLSEDELNLLASDIRENIIDNCAKNGGHIASSLGVVELTVAIHHFFNLPKDKLIFDVGHQSYAHKILSGRSLDNLRKENGVSGFQKRNESEYDPYEAGHSSTSISAAMGFAVSRDLNKEDYNIIAVIGDASLANGVAYEALNNLGAFDHKVILIINDNNQSIGKSVGHSSNMWEKFRLSNGYLKRKARYVRIMKKTAFGRGIYKVTSSIKNFFKYLVVRKNTFQNMGLYYISNIDGHDIKSLERAFKYAVNAPSSVAIHVTTIKGKGYEYAEKDNEGEWHGVAPFNKETGEPLTKLDDNHISWSEVYANNLMDIMKNNPQAVVVSPATIVGSKLGDIYKEFPDRTFDVGIAEEHAAIFASGMATSNLHPYVSMYSTFLQRSYDEISHDIARMNVPVTMLIDRVGLPGEDGETHEGIFDVAYLMSMPNVTICMGKDMNEAKQLMDFSVNYPYPLAIRYPRGSTLKQDSNGPRSLSLGQWRLENLGSGAAIISYGPVINELKERYKGYDVVNAIFQKPIDINLLKSLLDKDIVIYDLYGTKEGFASLVIDTLNDLGYKKQVKCLCVPNDFISHDKIINQRNKLHLDLDSLDALIGK